MTVQKRGASYDNEIANAIDGATGEYIRAHSMRGSGNTKYPNPDVLVRTPKGDHAIELKKASWDTGERKAVFDPDDVEELQACANGYTRLWAGVSFSNRQLLFVEAHEEDVGFSMAERIPDAFEATYTEAGYVRLTKPSSGEWPSAQAGKEDVDVILSALDLA